MNAPLNMFHVKQNRDARDFMTAHVPDVRFPGPMTRRRNRLQKQSVEVVDLHIFGALYFQGPSGE